MLCSGTERCFAVVTREQAVRAGVKRLVNSPSAARDARDLMCWVLGVDAARLVMDGHEVLSADEAARYEAAIVRRERAEPVSKIIGIRQFYGLEFAVTPDVLDPRPDTETMIDAVLEIAQEDRPLRILDLGTGSGCILLTLLHHLPEATGLGVDASDKALEIARKNAQRLQIEKKARFERSDWFEKVDGPFDLVVCNPPYIAEYEADDLSDDVLKWDPASALFSGVDGLSAFRVLSSGLSKALSETGTAFFEIGSGQGEAVARLFSGAGFDDLTFRRDIAGIQRCLIVRNARDGGGD